MDIEIKHIRFRDYKKAYEIIIKELHLDLYIKNKFLRKAYARYYWYSIMNKATDIYGAFSKTRFLGCVLLEMNNELSIHYSVYENAYIKIFNLIKKIFLKNIIFEEKTNHNLLKEFFEYHKIDGKLLFLGTIDTKYAFRVREILIKELSEYDLGKVIYVHTNNLCEYENYEKLGFDRIIEKSIDLNLVNGNKKTDCYIYIKKI